MILGSEPSSRAFARVQKHRHMVLVIGVLLFLPIYYASGMHLAGLFEASTWRVMGQFLSDFFPPKMDGEFLALVGRAMLETIAVASLGLSGAMIIGAPLALMGSRVLSYSQLGPSRFCFFCSAVRVPFRWLALVMRSLPEIIWALLFVRMTGLGPMAAILAIVVSYGGMLAKVYNDIMESGALAPSQSLMLSGAGRMQSFVFGVLPSVYKELISYSVYRWECALRATVVMGFVGAGGLGQQLEFSMRMFNSAETATLLLAFFFLVLMADGISFLLRWSAR